MIDGNKSKYSKAVVVAVSKPPKWDSPFKEGNEGDDAVSVSNLNFQNIFVYNFFTLDERTRYSFRNPTFKTTPDGLVDTAIRDITGRQVRGPAHWQRVSSNMIPSYIRLSWEPPPGFNDPGRVASQDRIEAFKYLGGLGNETKSTYQFSPITMESFELQQQDYVRATNEYLDMFSFDPDGNAINNWFAEELDSTNFQKRLEFLYNNIVNPSEKYKNFSGATPVAENNISAEDLSASHDDFNGTNMIDPVNGEPGDVAKTQVYDSALLENLNFPQWNKTLPEDTTIVLGTAHAWSIAGASIKNSGMLLGMQARVRRIKHWQEVLIKSEIPLGTTNLDMESVVESSSRTMGPLEHIVENSFPFEIEDLNRSVGQPELDFKLVGFVIEKTQRTETERGETDEVPLFFEKFPLIFVPCTADGGLPTTSYVDAAVNYDKEYDYSIRAVFSFSLDVPIEEGGELTTKRFHYFMNSPYSTVLTVETRELEPPPYPRDVWAFHEYYTAKDGALALHWAFPVTPQRDVAYFAIFRRKSIYEPFQLMEVFDFNYSISNAEESAQEIKAKIFGHNTTRSATGEKILYGDFSDSETSDTRYKIRRLKPGEPNTMYKDKDFRPDTDYIYAVCAIDAHGQMSNYSAQLKVRLDSRLYKLEVRQISSPGAPLVLPNFFMKTKAFQDVARTANYKRATLRFRPDYKSVKIDGQDKNRKIVHGIDEVKGGNPDNCYYLQIINPDRANDVVLKYQIDDRLELIDDPEKLKGIAELIGVPSSNLES